jgi:hypothetical protein
MRRTNHAGSSQPKIDRGVGRRPRQHRHARRARGRHPAQRSGIVDPQPDLLAAGGQVGREAPAHADVAVVVDDAAEQVPLHWPDYSGRLAGAGRRDGRRTRTDAARHNRAR